MHSIFQKRHIEQIARTTGFLKRKSKISPSLFIDLMFRMVSQRCSLDKLRAEAIEEHSVSVSKQGLDKRFSLSSISFSKGMLSAALSKQTELSSPENGKALFGRVLIKDSTRFHIDESLKGYFPGYGGDAPAAGVSIQFEYDLKQGGISDIALQSALSRDSTDALQKKELIQPKDLIIRDLGYYHGEVIKHISTNGAYYISRLHSSCNVYTQAEGSEKMDFGKLYRQMTKNGEKIRDISAYLGKDRILSRLIIIPMPEEVYAKRIRVRKTKNKNQPKSKSRSKDALKRTEHNARIEGQKGYSLSDEFKDRAHFNLFICNISPQDLSGDEIARFYRVRWQIELCFKVWKSLIHIHQIRKVKYERLVCFIYMSLLWIVVHWKILFPYQHFVCRQQGRFISIFKSMDTLKDHCREIRFMLRASKIIAGKELRRIYAFLADHHWLEKKKNKESFSDLYSLLFCKSNTYD